MALNLRLEHKMVQQLVMTPQLQQAIKLLQLSHLEIADVLREEMEQNPVLEERGTEADGGEGPDAGGDNNPGDLGNTLEPTQTADPDSSTSEIAQDLASIAKEAPADATPEPSSKEVEKEIDWEAYLDTYSYSLPATAGGGPNEDLPPFEATLTKPTSLHDHLMWQIQMYGFSEDQETIATVLVDEINDDGYLNPNGVETVAKEVECSEDEVFEVLRELQTFDPVGVASRNLRECLLIQYRHLSTDNKLLEVILDRHLKDVENRNYQSIAKHENATMEEVGEAIKLLGSFEPRPGRVYSDNEPRYITPDIYVYKVGDDYAIVLNEDGLPKLRISGYYRDALQNADGTEKSYIQDKLRSAAWLIRSIHMRQRTIYRVMESILKFQREFFDNGVLHLKPLILKDVAEDVGMHESTISRVTTNKYVHTPQGIYELKYFFNSSISRLGGDNIASESVRDHIKRLILEENPKRPLSDQQLVKLLKEQNIDIARRTVAKYREMLKIPSSSKRKQVF